ncbi:MAG: phosphate signaling complex protein PhoU [Phycisphaerales bacterium]|nr:phosphate signaling complex protein PhoU [Phycisphaerales bacterium]
MSEFDTQLSRLHDQLNQQGERVLDLTLGAVDAFFDANRASALEMIKSDELVDQTDILIERASIQLLALGQTDPYSIRSVLTIVKVNNELERIADCGVNIAECVPDEESGLKIPMPETFRVMANSVIGMIRDANRALKDRNPELARQVLLFDDTVDRFKNEILLDAQSKIAAGTFSVQFGFDLQTVTKSLERIADHATNICEQVIYLETGHTVRHDPEGWSEPFDPKVTE